MNGREEKILYILIYPFRGHCLIHANNVGKHHLGGIGVGLYM